MPKSLVAGILVKFEILRPQKRVGKTFSRFLPASSHTASNPLGHQSSRTRETTT